MGEGEQMLKYEFTGPADKAVNLSKTCRANRGIYNRVPERQMYYLATQPRTLADAALWGFHLEQRRLPPCPRPHTKV